MLFLIFAFLCIVIPSISSPTPYISPKSGNRLKSRDVPDPTICGKIIDLVLNGSYVFYASDAHDCLTSVPFNPAVATRFLEYYNTTIQFQSTLAYLKDPPVGYQQPAVDVFSTIKAIENNITSGVYQNQYAFEQDVQLLSFAMHDGHVDISAGISSVFTFASPYYISSVSVDGKKEPQIYFTGDIIISQIEGWEPSPIIQIDGEDAIEYLTKFAALQSFGNVESHADWNQLMASPALDIQGYPNIFGGDVNFYPGDELTFTVANGTTYTTYWIALYNGPQYTGPLTTGGDFYNFFVLGNYPASYNETLEAQLENPATPSSSSKRSVANPLRKRDAQPESWYEESYFAYPDNPDIFQPDLNITGGGILTGYFLDDISTAVLSIPSFEQLGNSEDTFTPTINSFIQRATIRNIRRVIIDLQQNTGGDVSLAINTTKQFFPNLNIFGGSRRRIHNLENTMGEAITAWWDQLDPGNETESFFHYFFAADEWVITDRINAATGNTFDSWAEYNTPKNYHNDGFSLTERYNLSDSTFNNAAFGNLYPYGYDPRSPISQTPPWQASEIVLLTDGLCSSACSLFLEIMTAQVGVKTVVMGGKPDGPPQMQAASGNRGAILYDADSLDFDILVASAVSDSAAAQLPNRDDTGMVLNWITLNLRDQIRENGTDPLQFQYLPANCRLYYTIKNHYNMTRLWRDVAEANWNDRSLCLPGSQSNSTAQIEPPVPSSIPIAPPVVNWPTNETIPDLGEGGGGGMQDARKSTSSLTPCDSKGQCTVGSCNIVEITCGSGPAHKVSACAPSCIKRSTKCGTYLSCQELVATTLQSQDPPNLGASKNIDSGHGTSTDFRGKCLPDPGKAYPALPGTFDCQAFLSS